MKKLILLTVIFPWCVKFGYSQAGEPDSSFGINGSVTTGFNSIPGVTQFRSIAVQPDGKVIVAGFAKNDSSYSLALARYTPNGALDKSFSADGKVSTDSATAVALAIQADGKILVAGSVLSRYTAVGSLDSSFSGDGNADSLSAISAMAIEPDGKIIAAGVIAHHLVLVRYNADGRLDSTFSTDGKLPADDIESILLQPDGKIITVGFFFYSDKGGPVFYIKLARYTAVGNLDTGFNGNGLVQYTPENEEWHNATSAALQSDGKILVAGSVGGDIAMVRFNNDGSIDNSFRLHAHIASFLNNPVIVQNDGKIVLGGTASNGTDYDLALERFKNDGKTDSSFGENGQQLTKVSGQLDVITSLALSGNRLYAAGSGDYYVNGIGVVAAYTRSGEPDVSFGSGGVVKTIFGSRSSPTTYMSTAIQPDGKIVAAGNTYNGSADNFAVARYNIDGSLDKTFGNEGKQTTDFGTGQSSIVTSVAVQKDGKIVVAGSIGTGISTNENFAVVRYNTDGHPDSTFGHNGKQITGFTGSSVQANSLAIQADGKIVVAGYINEGGESAEFAVARYNTDGSPDTTFDHDGTQTTTGLEKYSYGYSVAIQNDGKIIVAGTSTENAIARHIAVARYNTNGSLDKSFGGGIIQSTQLGGTNGFSSLALQANGKIVIAGHVDLTVSAQFRSFFTLFRYNTDGSPDKSFDKDGIKQAFKSEYFGMARSVAIQNDGKILAAGYVTGDNTYYPAFARFNPDGSLDTSFSGDGMLQTKTGSIGNINAGMAISKNGFYYVSTNGNQRGVVSRYLLGKNDDASPVVKIVAPADNAIYLPGKSVYIKAMAADADGTITKVTFYSDSTLLFTATDTPYAFRWQHLLKGNYALTVKATDDDGHITVSAPVHISVVNNRPPAVNIVSPSNHQVFLKGGTVHLRAEAADADGTISRVEFYAGTTLLTTEYKVPYTFDWRVGKNGDYVFTAKATDNQGATSTSRAINISVIPNQPPVVNIIAPANGQVFTATATGATINVEAEAEDGDGRIAQVRFYNGTTLLTGSEHKVPYTYQWKNVPPGTYTITAIAKDIWSAETTSAPVTITVTPADEAPAENRLFSTLSLAGIKEEKHIRLSPNPAEKMLSINISGFQKNTPSTISVISAAGVTLCAKQLNNLPPTIQLDVSSLISGIYLLKISSGDRFIYKRFVKM